jgi:hypothetical protein
VSNDSLDQLGGNDHRDHRSRPTIACWPEAMDLETIGAYTSTSTATARDWVRAGLLQPLKLPGSCIRARNGRVILRPQDHELHKIIIMKTDVDAFLARCRGAA